MPPAGRSLTSAGTRSRRRTSSCTYYPEERAFAERSAHVAERGYRLITRYLNWRPSGRVNVALLDHTDTPTGWPTRSRTTTSRPTARRPRGWTSVATSTTSSSCWSRTRYPRRAPGHDPELVPAAGQHDLRQDLRAQPVAAELVHRRAGGVDGVTPDYRGAAAQQLSTCTCACRFSKGSCSASTHVVGGPIVFPARQRPLPVRREHPALRRGSLRPGEGPRDLAPLRRRVHPGGINRVAAQARRARVHRPCRRRHLGGLEAVDVAPLHAGDRGGRSGAG